MTATVAGKRVAQEAVCSCAYTGMVTSGYTHLRALRDARALPRSRVICLATLPGGNACWKQQTQVRAALGCHHAKRIAATGVGAVQKSHH